MTVSHYKLLYACIGSCLILWGQVLLSKEFPFPGEKPLDPGCHAFWGGDIQVSPDLKIRDGILFVKDGKIEKVAKNIEISPIYREWNCSGKTIYPGFIDPYILTGKESPSLLSLGHQQTVLAQSDLKFSDFLKILMLKLSLNLAFLEFIPKSNYSIPLQLKNRSGRSFESMDLPLLTSHQAMEFFGVPDLAFSCIINLISKGF